MSQSSNLLPTKQIKQKQVDQLLQLQQLFHTRFLTVDLLNQLIASYVDAIQCFDGHYSPMRKYFLNKIQFVVSRPEIDTMLKRNAQGDNNMMGIIRQTIRLTSANGQLEQGLSQQRLMQVLEAENKQRNKNMKKQNVNKTKNQKQKQPNSNSNNFYLQSPQKTKLSSQQPGQQQKYKQRHNKIQLQMKVMRQIQQNMKNISQQIQQEDIKITNKNKRLNALMEEQNNSLQNRLAMRKRGKKRKNSGDQKQIKQRQQVEPIIKKQQLKQAQKQIQQAVVRMTIRMSQRLSNLNNIGSTGLLMGTINQNSTGSRNTGGNTAKRLEQQKTRGRIKIKNQVKEQQDEDQDFLALDFSKKVQKKQDNPEKGQSKQQKKPQQKQKQKQKDPDLPADYESRNSQFGTGRFTMGTQNGGRGRITVKRRDTKRIDEDQDEII